MSPGIFHYLYAMKRIILFIAIAASLASCYKYEPVKVFSYKRTDTALVKNDKQEMLSIMIQHIKEDRANDCFTIAYNARNNDLDAYIVFDTAGYADVYIFDPKKTTAELDFIKKLGVTIRK